MEELITITLEEYNDLRRTEERTNCLEPDGSDYAVFSYVEQPLGEPLLDQVTHWLPLDRALSYAKANRGFVLSRFIPKNT